MDLFKKIHKITTVIAVFSGFIAAVFIFTFFVDEILNLNIVGYAFESVLALAAILGTILFAITALISLLLSLYFLSYKN